jgi:hypothetical protein
MPIIYWRSNHFPVVPAFPVVPDFLVIPAFPVVPAFRLFQLSSRSGYSLIIPVAKIKDYPRIAYCIFNRFIIVLYFSETEISFFHVWYGMFKMQRTVG